MEQVEQLFNSFENKLLEISLYGSFIVDESTNQYKEYLMKFSKIDTLKDEKIVKTRLVYLDILSNHKKILSDSKIEKNVNELLKSAEYHKNKQLQWLFVEAYELYKKHIDDLYCLIGSLDNNFWDLQDFGKVSINDIKNFTQEDFANKVLKKENRPYSIIEVFEKKLNLKKHDDIKEPFRNYSFLVALLSELRNAIVHENGFFDRNRLSKKLLKKHGINGNSNKEIYEDMISSFFGSQEYESMICLTKVLKANEVVKDLFYTDKDRFKEIIGVLISYIKLISDLLIKRMKS